MKQIAVLLVLLVLTLIRSSPDNSQQTQEQIYYVAMNGNDSNPGTEIQPFRTLAKGVSVLGPGDILYIKSGTYTESVDAFPSGISWVTPVTLRAYPGDTVTIKPESNPNVLRFIRCQYVIIDGFILDGANIENDIIKITSESHHIRIQNTEVMGGPQNGILVTNHGLVYSEYNQFLNLDVHDNGITDNDHGIYLASGNNIIDSSKIHNNSGWGIHIYSQGCQDCTSDNIVRNNSIYDNASAGDRGSGIVISSGNRILAYNNIIWGNNVGVQVDQSLYSKVYNNVIHANHKYGVLIEDSENIAIRNNIIYQNDNSDILDLSSDTIQDHNLIDIDPQFVNTSAHDFHLRPTSPGIDAGIALSEVPYDYDGISRPRGEGFDIGAYEFPYSFRVKDLRVVDAVPDTSSLTVTLRWTASFDAVSYTLRSSSTPLTVANWSEAPIVTDLIPASPPGSIEWLTTTVDYTGKILYLALKSQDSEGAWSKLSNNAFWPHWDFYLPLFMKNNHVFGHSDPYRK